MVWDEVVSNFVSSVALLAPIYKTSAAFPESCSAAKFMSSVATVYFVPLQKTKGDIVDLSSWLEECHCAGINWSLVHFTKKFWQKLLQHMRKRDIQSSRWKHFR